MPCRLSSTIMFMLTILSLYLSCCSAYTPTANPPSTLQHTLRPDDRNDDIYRFRRIQNMQLNSFSSIAVAAAVPVNTLSKIFQVYENVLVRYPWPTKIVSSGVIGGLGDILIQWVENRVKENKRFNFRRFAVFTSVAAFYIAPAINIWFTFLNNLHFLQNMSNFSKAMIMMIIDQTAGAVIINGGFFYAFSLVDTFFPPSKMQLNFIATANNAIRSSFWETLKTNWMSWPLINFINFLLIPLRYRLLFSNFFAVFWNMFLSKIANRT